MCFSTCQCQHVFLTIFYLGQKLVTLAVLLSLSAYPLDMQREKADIIQGSDPSLLLYIVLLHFWCPCSLICVTPLRHIHASLLPTNTAPLSSLCCHSGAKNKRCPSKQEVTSNLLGWKVFASKTQPPRISIQ